MTSRLARSRFASRPAVRLPDHSPVVCPVFGFDKYRKLASRPAPTFHASRREFRCIFEQEHTSQTYISQIMKLCHPHGVPGTWAQHSNCFCVCRNSHGNLFLHRMQCFSFRVRCAGENFWSVNNCMYSSLSTYLDCVLLWYASVSYYGAEAAALVLRGPLGASRGTRFPVMNRLMVTRGSRQCYFWITGATFRDTRWEVLRSSGLEERRWRGCFTFFGFGKS